MLNSPALALALTLAGRSVFAAAQEPRVLDDFEQISAWSARPSEGVTVRLSADSGVRGRAMRVDFDFHGGSGYALIHRSLNVDLPANYAFSFYLRATSPPNNLEFKLIDSTGDNVWWSNERDFEFPRTWTKLTRRKRQIDFAWGPAGGGEIRHVAALEIAITAGRGGKGTVWLDELTLTPLDSITVADAPPNATATSSQPNHAPGLAVDGDTTTYWESGATSDAALTLDFVRTRELGGLTIDWSARAPATQFAVELSDDGAQWHAVRTVRGGTGKRDYIYLPETETRFLRVRAPGPIAIRELRVQPVAWSATPNAFFRSLAADAAKGDYPRYLSDQMVYWTVTGASGDTRQALVSEDGSVEPFAYEWSLEPFLRVGDTLLTWADVRRDASLERGSLPVPTVTWTHGNLALSVTAVTARARGATLLLRYRLRNAGRRPRDATLLLAVRPFQVNTPWQFLNGTGGVGRIHAIAYDETQFLVRGRDSTRAVVPLTPPTSVGVATFDNGNVVEMLRAGRLPIQRSVNDPLGFASGVLGYALTVAPNDTRDVYVAVPLHASSLLRGGFAGAAQANELASESFAEAIDDWQTSLGGVRIALPKSADRIVETLRTSLAYMLIERDAAALRPGTRAYARTWIRDGALMSAALLRLGRAEVVRQFIEWFAPYQRPDGRVPCCVDARGADPVAEHDSHGELIYLIAEYWRIARDSAFLARIWPHVELAVSYIDSLRRSEMTDQYRTAENGLYFGLLPPSISHEGYSAKPMHSYWDDFFALKGLVDATQLATILGRADEARRYAAIRDDFRANLLASIRLSMARHTIDYIPGSADLGDFDATSTTIAIAPGGELANLPDTALRRTFEKYYENFRARRDGTLPWDAYTPYELRTVGTFVRLGWKDRAHELLDFFFTGQRPAAWRQWAEVVWKDSLAPKFIGDMPHAWVASDYVRSVLDFFAYERDSDSALVIGAGIPERWVREAPGVSVQSLRTHYGSLSLTMRESSDTVMVVVGRPLRMPRGGIVVRSPSPRPIRRAFADGVALSVDQRDEVVLRAIPRRLLLVY